MSTSDGQASHGGPGLLRMASMRIGLAPLVVLAAAGAEASELPYFRLMPGGSSGLGIPSGVPSPRIALSPPASATGQPVAGVPLSAELSAIQGRIARWSLRDAPAWLAVDALTGAIAGTPPAGTEAFSFVGVGTDAYGRSVAVPSGPVAVAAPAAGVQALSTTVRPGDYVHGQLATNLPGASWSKVSGPDWVLVGHDGFVAGQVPPDASGVQAFTARASAYGAVAVALGEILVLP